MTPMSAKLWYILLIRDCESQILHYKINPMGVNKTNEIIPKAS